MNKKVLLIYASLFFSAYTQLQVVNADIIVVDDVGNGIEGVTFRIFDDVQVIAQLETDQQGRIDTTEYNQQCYKVQEYALSPIYEQEQIYYVLEPDKDLKIVHKKKTGGVLITIQNEEETLLANEPFALYNENDEFLKEISTDTYGQLILTDLQLGDYYLVYLGDDVYEQSEDNLSFCITAYNYQSTLNLTYFLKKSVPNTLTITDIVTAMIVSLVCISIGVYFVYQLQKEKFS